MKTTILESLQNANYNINCGEALALYIGKSQLNTAVTLLEKSYDLDDDIIEILDDYDSDLKKVPNKMKH